MPLDRHVQIPADCQQYLPPSIPIWEARNEKAISKTNITPWMSMTSERLRSQNLLLQEEELEVREAPQEPHLAHSRAYPSTTNMMPYTRLDHPSSWNCPVT